MKIKTLVGIVSVIILTVLNLTHAQDLQPVANPPAFGNFYSISHPEWPPLPCLPPFPVAVYSLGSNNFLFDDSTIDLSAASRMSTSDPLMPPGSDNTNYYQPDFNTAFNFNTNLLWLEPTGVASNQTYITAHNVIQDYFELWSKTNLLDQNWKIEQQFYRSVSNSVLPLAPVAETNSVSTNSQMFFWAAEADTLVDVTNQQDAYEIISGYTPGQSGFFSTGFQPGGNGRSS